MLKQAGRSYGAQSESVSLLAYPLAATGTLFAPLFLPGTASPLHIGGKRVLLQAANVAALLLNAIMRQDAIEVNATGSTGISRMHVIPMTSPRYSQAVAGVKREAVEMDMRGLVSIVRRNLWPIALTTLGALALSLLYLSVAAPVYTASATIFIDPRARKIVSEEVVPGGIAIDTSLVESQVSIIGSDAVLRRAAQKLKLAEDPEFAPPAATGLMADIKAFIRGRRAPLEAESQAVETLIKSIKVKRAQRTYIVELEVSASSPVKAALIANAITEAYLADQTGAKTDEAKRARGLIDARLGELRDKLRSAEQRVDEFRKTNKILTSEGGIVTEQQLGKLNFELATARAVAAEAKARFQQTSEAVRSGRGVEALPEAMKSGLVQKLREQSAQVARREAALSSQLQGRHPVLIEVRSQLKEITRQINAELKRISVGSKNEYEIAANRERELVRTIERSKTDISRTNTAQIRLRELEQEAEASRDLMRTFLNRAKETQEQEKLSTSEARVISPAAVPSRPSRPSPWLVLALGLAGGLGAGIGRALLRDHLDPSVHTLADTALPEREKPAAEPAGLKTLGIIPSFHPVSMRGRLVRHLPGSRDNLEAAHFSDLLAALDDSGGQMAPAYRQGVLRLLGKIKAEAPADTPAVAMFVSPDRAAGTSATALAVAYAAALAGDRVLLVDACSPNPELSKTFAPPLKRDEVVVLDSADHLQRIVTEDQRSGLSFLPIAQADLRTLKGQQRRRLAAGISALAERFDLVLIDAGAVLADEAAMCLLPAVDQVILVARANQTRPRDLAAARDTLETARAKLSGTVLTMAPDNAG